jgi:hypothetical protein
LGFISFGMLVIGMAINLNSIDTVSSSFHTCGFPRAGQCRAGGGSVGRGRGGCPGRCWFCLGPCVQW